MTKSNKQQDQLDKRAAALRDNLKKRKALKTAQKTSVDKDKQDR